MSVQSEITRLANAKTALATAIEGKGVTVPEGTKLDGMAALVESIEAGGSKFATGNMTFSSDVKYTGDETISTNLPRVVLTIEHGLGYRPTFFVFFSQDKDAAYKLQSMIVHWIGGGFYDCYRVTFNSYGTTASNNGGSEYIITEESEIYWTDTIVSVSMTSANALLPAGHKYYWVVW